MHGNPYPCLLISAPDLMFWWIVFSLHFIFLFAENLNFKVYWVSTIVTTESGLRGRVNMAPYYQGTANEVAYTGKSPLLFYSENAKFYVKRIILLCCVDHALKASLWRYKGIQRNTKLRVHEIKMVSSISYSESLVEPQQKDCQAVGQWFKVVTREVSSSTWVWRWWQRALCLLSFNSLNSLPVFFSLLSHGNMWAWSFWTSGPSTQKCCIIWVFLLQKSLIFAQWLSSLGNS